MSINALKAITRATHYLSHTLPPFIQTTQTESVRSLHLKSFHRNLSSHTGAFRPLFQMRIWQQQWLWGRQQEQAETTLALPLWTCLLHSWQTELFKMCCCGLLCSHGNHRNHRAESDPEANSKGVDILEYGSNDIGRCSRFSSRTCFHLILHRGLFYASKLDHLSDISTSCRHALRCQRLKAGRTAESSYKKIKAFYSTDGKWLSSKIKIVHQSCQTQASNLQSHHTLQCKETTPLKSNSNN